MQKGFSAYFGPIVIFGFAFAFGFSRLLGADSNRLILNIRLSEISHTDSSLKMRETLMNNGTGDLWILQWRVPWSGRLEAPLFIVKDDDGLSVAYTGVLVKKHTPTIQDFVLLKSGDCMVFDVDLEKYYRMHAGECYSITVDELLIDARQVVGDKGFGAERVNIECAGLVAKLAR